MIEKAIRKKLLEERKKRKTQLIESKLIENRILLIIESKKKFESLPVDKQKKVFLEVLKEVRKMEEMGLINEQFGDMLKGIFGSLFSGVSQSFIEPLVNSVLSWFGLGGGYFQKFMVSFIVSDPTRIARAFKDCRELTKLIAESLSEAMVMMVQQKQGVSGMGYDILRNTLGDAIKKTDFVSDLESKLANGVCKVFGKATNNAKDVLGKIKGEENTVGSETLALN